MKSSLIILLVVITSLDTTKVQGQPLGITDTLQWLKINIEQHSSYYDGKQLSVLLDTLCAYGLADALLDYTSPLTSDNAPAWTRPGDIVWTNHFTIYMGELYGGGVKAQLHDANPNTNTHIPKIHLTFTKEIPFPSTMLDVRILGHRWTTEAANLCKTYIVESVSVGEY